MDSKLNLNLRKPATTTAGISKTVDEALPEVVERIVQNLQPVKIILFGSYAHGSPSPDSDVDLLVVMESDERPVARSAQVSGLLRPRPFPIDILVRTPEEIEHRLEIGDQFIREIIEKGKVLYAR